MKFDLLLLTQGHHCEFHFSLVINTVVSTIYYSPSVLGTLVIIVVICLHVSVASWIMGSFRTRIISWPLLFHKSGGYFINVCQMDCDHIWHPFLSLKFWLLITVLKKKRKINFVKSCLLIKNQWCSKQSH